MAATDLHQVLGHGVVYPALGLAKPPTDQAAANEAATTLLYEFEQCFLIDEAGSAKKFVLDGQVSVAEYRILPFLFAAAQPAVQQRTGFTLSSRMESYMKDAMAAIPGSTFLTSH